MGRFGIALDPLARQCRMSGRSYAWNLCVSLCGVSPFCLSFFAAVSLSQFSEWLQLAVTDMGLLYSWGSNTDGALGHGNTDSLRFPRLVDYFGLTHPLFVLQAAAGSDVIGSHSMVVVASPDDHKKTQVRRLWQPFSACVCTGRSDRSCLCGGAAGVRLRSGHGPGCWVLAQSVEPAGGDGPVALHAR